MAYVPLQQAQEQFLGGSKSSSSSGKSYVPLQQAQAAFLSPASSKSQPQPTKTTQVKPISSSSPSKQQSNPFMNMVGGIYNGIVGEIGSIIKPPSKVSTPKIQVTQTKPLPMGMSLTLSSPQANQSAKQTITKQSLQKQQQGVEQTKKVINTVKDSFPQTAQAFKDLSIDPLNFKANPKKAVDHAVSTLKDAWKQESTAFNDWAKQPINKSGKGSTDSFNKGVHLVTGSANLAFSPVSAIFNAANDVPVLGSLSKLLNIGFTGVGETGSNVAISALNHVPNNVLSPKVKNNVREAVGEIGSLATQMLLGKVTEVKPRQRFQLIARYGSEDAKTIIDKATEIAKSQTVEPGTHTPQEIRNQVFQKGIEETPHGKELLKSSIEADQQGKHITINSPEIHTFNKNLEDYRSFGGYSAGKSTPNAALRDIEVQAEKPAIKEHTQEQVKSAIDYGEITPNEDGTITLYRGGKPSSQNGLVSASYDKSIAQSFAKDGQLHEIQVKPEDIKAFIGKAEKEVLIDKSAINPEKPKVEAKVTTSEPVTVRYDSKGREIKPPRVLTTKEVKEIRISVRNRIDHVNATAESPEDYGRGIEKVVAEVQDKSKGDKEVLSALRTEINKEMYSLAGIGENANYKEAFRTLESVKKTDPVNGELIKKLEGIKEDLDNKLLSAKRSPGGVEVPTKQGKHQTNMTSVQEPVGTGKLRKSQAYKNFLAQLEHEYPDVYNSVKDDPDLLYNKVNQLYDFENAAKLVTEDPQRAYNIAKGYEAPPEGQRQTSVAMMLSNRALKEGNIKLMTDLEKTTSLASTRRGQELYALRGRYDDASPQKYIQQVLDQRLRELGKSALTSSINTAKKVVGKVGTSVKENAIARIDQAVERAQKFTAKERAKINYAQKILDELTCK